MKCPCYWTVAKLSFNPRTIFKITNVTHFLGSVWTQCSYGLPIHEYVTYLAIQRVLVLQGPNRPRKTVDRVKRCLSTLDVRDKHQRSDYYNLRRYDSKVY